MTKRLIVGDVDQIQSYVFGSSRLRAIRGASALLEKAVEEFVRTERLHKGNVNFLRSRGGQLVAILTGDKTNADNFCARLESAVRRATGGAASITTAHVAYDDSALFRHALRGAFGEIRREKDGRQEFGIQCVALLASPYYHRCDLLPTHPASFYSVVGDVGEEEERYLSQAAQDRWNAVGADRKNNPTQQISELDRKLLDKLDATLIQQGYEFPHQPDDLWKGEDEGGYMGYVAADGNSIGQMLEAIRTEELYEGFSEEMHEIVLGAISQAAQAVRIPDKHRFTKKKKRKKETKGEETREKAYNYVPLVPVIVAGDDMSLLVRAGHAFRFIEQLGRGFANKSQVGTNTQQVIREFCRDRDFEKAARSVFPDCFENGALKPEGSEVWAVGQPLTLSAGVAIAKKKFPISIYRRLAGELRDEAKRALRDKGSGGAREGGMIDFAVITTATAQRLEDLRRRYRLDSETRLTMRPYTLSKFGELLELANELKKLPRSKRKFVYTELFAGRVTGETAYRFVMGRESRQRQDELFAAMGKLGPGHGEVFAAAPGKNEHLTPLVDALEVAELLEED